MPEAPWGAVSDKIGRLNVFKLMLASEIIVLLLMMHTQRPIVFGAFVCYMLLCYGGGFGTMPSLVLDAFGAKRMAFVYGTILTAWSAAGIVGPQMVAMIKDRFPQNASYYSFAAACCFVTLGLLLSLVAKTTKEVE